MFPNKRGRKSYITPAFSGIPNIGEQNQKWLPRPYLLGGPKEGGRGTETKVANKRAEVLRHPCVLGGPQTRGQSQRWPTSGRKCYVTNKWPESSKA